MDSFEETRRQLRFALIAIAIVFPTGIIGYMLIEQMPLLDAMWITIITLATIGYGDIVPRSDAGRLFTLFLIVCGLGAFALAAQAAVQIFVSPVLRAVRERRRAERKIGTLRDHYIICGEGELVDQTISYLLKRAELRRALQREALLAPIQQRLEQFFGSRVFGLRARFRRWLERAFGSYIMFRHRSETLLDAVVVITQNEPYAEHLRSAGLLVIHDDPTDDQVLRRAGIAHARAVMSMLASDTETLLNVLTIRNRNSAVYITAATQNDLGLKMIRVGANNVLAPYEVAGQFLNNATLRPAVNEYFNSILFDHKASAQVIQLFLMEGSPWIGQRIGDLHLRDTYQAGVMGLRTPDGQFVYAPGDTFQLEEDVVLLVVAPGQTIPKLQAASQGHVVSADQLPNWQRLPTPHNTQKSEKVFSMREAEEAIKEMTQHFVICGSGPVIHNALNYLNPERPFVVLSSDSTLASDMLKRGFRVILGNPAQDDTLKRAGIERALAIMVSIEDKADSVLTVLNCRTLNRGLLIVATASTDDMIPKLRRAGADRVVSPFRIAAQFMLLATTRPVVSDFMQHVIFNYQVGIETTELYMQDDSPWIGKRVGSLRLESTFHAGVIGIRQANGRFVYAPPEDYVLGEKEVIIVITPMQFADELRSQAHGGGRVRPTTLRTQDIVQTVSELGAFD